MNPGLSTPSILDIPLKRWFPANRENVLVVLLLLMAVVSRFYNLGAMTITFDENNHVTSAYSLYTGRGYQYNPVTHGPLQMHMMALSYALFGDDDFTSRIPAAVLSVATIVLAIFAFRRYLGRAGALLAGLMLTISPFMLFYGRYDRNEAYIVLWALLTLYSILRYLDSGEKWVLVLFTAVNALHFTDKATAFMFAGEEILFLLAYLIDRLTRREWQPASRRVSFLMGLIMAVILLAGAAGLYLAQKPLEALGLKIGLAALGIGGLGALIWAACEAVRGIGWSCLKSERALDLILLLGTCLLPLLGWIVLKVISALPSYLKVPWKTFTILEYTVPGALRASITALCLGALAVVIGLWWFGRRWWLYAAVFFVPYILFYSTFFTSPGGLIGGLVGVLDYWFGQHSIQRVYQPYFYYALVEIPLAEFLPALGTIAAVLIAFREKLWQSKPGQPFASAAGTTSEEDKPAVPVAALLLFWSFSSLALFSYAGERAPWLTVHIALPLILTAAWAFGWMIETIPWGKITAWGRRQYLRAAGLAFFGLLAVLTGRTAFRDAYLYYDYPFNYLVYAHHSPYPKVVYNEIMELSLRTTGGTDMRIAYDDDVWYPYWWYMRRYSGKLEFFQNPTREARQALVVLCGDDLYSKVLSIVGDNYYEFKYPRLWWQNMDFWNLDWKSIALERSAALQGEYAARGEEVPPMTVFDYLEYAWPHIRPFFTDPAVRRAVWQIWFNRDFSQWAAVKNSEYYSATQWAGAQYLHVFIRKDIVAKLWPYGAEAVELPEPADPYAGITIPISPDRIIGTAGLEAGQFQAPRALALAADGSLYVADSLNHRIQHLSPDGQVLHVWGSYADAMSGNAPAGTFNEPWGVAVGPDGSVYVSDTWNHRIQKFTADGQFLTMWGYGPTMELDGFYGPRGIAVDSEGRVYVADTGNKRIMIFDSDGRYITKIGEPGIGLGQLDEPVDIALDAFGNIYVTDTWNQRVQYFAPTEDGFYYIPVAEWPVSGWYGNSLQNKPFITVDSAGNIFFTDPEACRVFAFSSTGQPLRVWDGCAEMAFLIPSGIVSDGAGGLWVSDAAEGRLVHFEVEFP